MVIRQARIFLAGGVSGAALIAISVVAFVLLVSLQTLGDWPLNGLGGSRSGVVRDSSAVARPTGARGPVVAGAPAAGVGAPVSRDRSGNGGATPGAGGDAPGSPATAHPVARAPSSSPAAESGGSAQSRGSGNSAPDGGSGSRDGGGSTPSLSQTVAGTINDTVAGVDGATGGEPGNAGVTEATEDAVNGVVGPKSAVGRVADSTTEAVGGLPGADR